MMLLAAGVAQAHPGHFAGHLLHFFSEPDHLAMLLLPAVIGFALWFCRRPPRTRRHRRDAD